MNEDPVKLARRDALSHAMMVLGTTANMRNAGTDERMALLSARELIAERGIRGIPGSAEYQAGEAERAAILKDIDDARAGAGTSAGLGPLTWTELRIQARLKAILF